MRIPFQYTSPLYDSAEFQVANGTTDYDVASNQTNTFGGADSSVGKPVYFISLRSDQTVTVKLNSTSNDAITITSTSSPLELDEVIEVSNIYITNNSGSAANIRLLLAKPVER